MSEYFGGTNESDDDDSESTSSPDRHVPERASAKPIGEVLFGQDKAEKAAEKHQTLWERGGQEPERPGLFAAIAEKAASEKAVEKTAEPDDDDDDEEERKAVIKEALPIIEEAVTKQLQLPIKQ